MLFRSNQDLTYRERPLKILEEDVHVTRRRAIKFYKVQWTNHSEEEATWEPPSRPIMGMLKHDTKCRPRLPFSSVLLTIRLRASGRGQSGHLLIGTAPYSSHLDCVAEELDIPCAVAGEEEECGKGKKWHGHQLGHGRSSDLDSVRWVPRC